MRLEARGAAHEDRLAEVHAECELAHEQLRRGGQVAKLAGQLGVGPKAERDARRHAAAAQHEGRLLASRRRPVGTAGRLRLRRGWLHGG